MSINVHTCVSAVCDTCGDHFGEEGDLHFPTAEEALNELRRNAWLVTDARLLCSSCALAADCDATGHQHGSWQDGAIDGVTYRQRFCEHCGTSEFDPPREQLHELLYLARVVNGVSHNIDSEGGL